MTVEITEEYQRRNPKAIPGGIPERMILREIPKEILEYVFYDFLKVILEQSVNVFLKEFLYEYPEKNA